MTRAYAWAPRGERAVGSAPGQWESFTVVAALGLDGVHAPLVIPGSLDAAAFETYVADVLAPELRPGDVVDLGPGADASGAAPRRRPCSGRVRG